MKITEIITEVFQPGKTWSWEFKGSEEAFASFKVGEVEYLWSARVLNSRTNPAGWTLAFQVREKGDWDKTFGITGTGNSTEVMSTAVDITRTFLQEYGNKVLELKFSSLEDSRTKLYAKMIKRLLPNWDLHSKVVHSETNFYLTNPVAYELTNEGGLTEVGDTFYDVDQTGVHKPSFNSRLKREKIGLPSQGVSTFFEFTTASGTKYKIEIIQNKLKQGGAGVNVIFTNQTAISKGNDSIGITNDGDAIKVFSTVKAVLARYLKDHPEIIIVGFSAKTAEPSRVKLYQMFAKQFQRWFPQFTNFKSKNNGDFTAFGVSIPQTKQVEEEVLDEMPLPADWDPRQFDEPTTSFKSRLAYALERAKKLGTGSSRVATTIEYQGRPTVLKIAKNQKGLAQNSVEASILEDGYASQLDILIPLIDYDTATYNREPVWIHTEQAQKVNEKQLCAIMKCDNLSQLVNMAWAITGKKRFVGSYQTYINKFQEQGHSEEDIETVSHYANVLADLHMQFDVELGDFARAANWGLFQGKPVIIDVGFNSNVLNQYYR